MADHNRYGTKSRLMLLYDWLQNETDDEHYLTTEDILQLYHDHGMKCTRDTVRDDIAVLENAGVDIIRNLVNNGNGTLINAYHIGARLFELAELRMLVDAVSSSRFITMEKSNLLVEKLSKLTNSQNRPALIAQARNEDRLKTSNSAVFISMDVIRTAIDTRRKITFHMWDYTIRKERILRHEGKLYTASPLALIWNDDRYYMVSWSEKYEKTIKFRVDRMCDVTLTEEPAVVDDAFNPATYNRSMIKMYDDDLSETEITLLCGEKFMTNILDRFGEGTETEPVDEHHFRARVSVIPSSTFFAWVAQYEGGILIESPTEVRNGYETMLKNIMDAQWRMMQTASCRFPLVHSEKVMP